MSLKDVTYIPTGVKTFNNRFDVWNLIFIKAV